MSAISPPIKNLDFLWALCWRLGKNPSFLTGEGLATDAWSHPTLQIKRIHFESESFLKKVASDVFGQAIRTAPWGEEAQSVVLSKNHFENPMTPQRFTFIYS